MTVTPAAMPEPQGFRYTAEEIPGQDNCVWKFHGNLAIIPLHGRIASLSYARFHS